MTVLRTTNDRAQKHAPKVDITSILTTFFLSGLCFHLLWYVCVLTLDFRFIVSGCCVLLQLAQHLVKHSTYEGVTCHSDKPAEEFKSYHTSMVRVNTTFRILYPEKTTFLRSPRNYWLRVTLLGLVDLIFLNMSA